MTSSSSRPEIFFLYLHVPFFFFALPPRSHAGLPRCPSLQPLSPPGASRPQCAALRSACARARCSPPSRTAPLPSSPCLPRTPGTQTAQRRSSPGTGAAQRARAGGARHAPALQQRRGSPSTSGGSAPQPRPWQQPLPQQRLPAGQQAAARGKESAAPCPSRCLRTESWPGRSYPRPAHALLQPARWPAAPHSPAGSGGGAGGSTGHGLQHPAGLGGPRTGCRARALVGALAVAQQLQGPPSVAGAARRPAQMPAVQGEKWQGAIGEGRLWAGLPGWLRLQR
jgi:hypothetical protein